MKTLLGLLTVALLSLGAASCGASSKGTGTASRNHSDAVATGSASATATSSLVPTQGYLKNDRDNDGDHNDDDEQILTFGNTNRADNRTIAALVTHYYAAAAAEDGARACSLLAPFIAESVVENYGHTPALRGRTCAVVISKLLKRDHRELVGKNATLKVIRVGVEGDKSLVVLYFPRIPEVRQITARRGGNSWRMLTLLDGILE